MTDPASLRDRVLEWLASPSCRPLGKSELARSLGVHPNERAELRRILDALEREGVAEIRKGGRYGPAGGKADVARGVFETTFRGKNRVRILTGGRAIPPDDDGIRRIDIDATAAGTALPGDVVELRLKRRSPMPMGRRGAAKSRQAAPAETVWEGRVIGILEEGRRTTTGIYRRQGKFRVVEVEDKKYPALLGVSECAPGANPEDGDLVLARIIRWDSPERPPVARIEKVLGDPTAPGNDMRALILRFDLPVEFPEAVLAEAAAMPDAVRASDLDGRDDWRGRLVVTIDPFDARDFDDAIHVTRRDDGWLLAVHIADVSHYVKPGTALDTEAEKRGNSVYLVDRVLPMLPEKISNGLCSLVPGEDRLSRLVQMEFDAKGRMTKAAFASAVIRSARRYTYEEAFAVLDADEPAPAADPAGAMLHEAWRLASLLRRRRFKQGSLDLDFPEVKVVLDQHGRPVELRKVEHDISHQLIEEFMLAANEAVAREVRNAGLPCIYRVHDDPDEDKLWEFHQLARLHGFPPQAGDGRNALQALLQRIRGEPEEHPLKLALLKSLKRATYAAEPRGHYGLAKANYLHFTSPIRRYADLVAHRVIGKWSGHKPPLPCNLPKHDVMAEIASHISATERVAADAEIESRKMKEMEYFERLLQSGEPVAFPAVVTEARRAGLFIELVDLQIRGLVPPSGFPPGDWWFEPEATRWRHPRTHAELRPGGRVEARITRVEKENRFLDFRITGWGPAQASSPKRLSGSR